MNKWHCVTCVLCISCFIDINYKQVTAFSISKFIGEWHAVSESTTCRRQLLWCCHRWLRAFLGVWCLDLGSFFQRRTLSISYLTCCWSRFISFKSMPMLKTRFQFYWHNYIWSIKVTCRYRLPTHFNVINLKVMTSDLSDDLIASPTNEELLMLTITEWWG